MTSLSVTQIRVTERSQTNIGKHLIVVSFLAIAGLAALPFDVLLAQFFMSDPFPGELRSLIHKTEFFGHAYGILGIVLTIYLLDEGMRRRIPRLLAAPIAAGLFCDAVKMLVHRVRPCDYSFADDAPTFLGLSFQHATSLGDVFNSAYHSFPSAHTATAVAFAMLLGSLYPKGAKWFLVLAATVAISRFDGGAHYVSDTCFGAIVGYLSATWILVNPRVGRWFDRFERRSNLPLLRRKSICSFDVSDINEPLNARVLSASSVNDDLLSC